MADYLTLLARRSVGLVKPVEPVRVHRYAERPAGGDGLVEEVVGESSLAGRSIATGSVRSSRSGSGSPWQRTTPAQPSPPAAPAADEEMHGLTPVDEPDGAIEHGRPRWRRDGAEVSNAESPEEQKTSAAPAVVVERVAPELLVPDWPGELEVEPLPGVHRVIAESEAGPGKQSQTGREPLIATREPVESTRLQAAAPPHDREASTRRDTAAVEVSIGSIEIRAVKESPPAAAPQPRRVAPKLSLEDYLEQRRRGER